MPFGGIDAVVMADANIIELAYQKATPQMIHWVSLHESTLIDTRYIVHLILASGNKLVDILSVVFTKPEQRTKKAINILTERRVNARRALIIDEICTIIFATAQALQQFIYSSEMLKHGKASQKCRYRIHRNESEPNNSINRGAMCGYGV